MAQTVSVILPVFNEGTLIYDTLTHFLSLGATEVLVVDGGSQDETLQQVARFGSRVRVLHSPRAERAAQLNLGAKASQAEILVFAHADMRFPQDALKYVRDCLKTHMGGGFYKRYRPTNFYLNTYGYLLNHVYLDGLRKLVGTNAIFLRKRDFQRLGAFDLEMLEDVKFSRRLKQHGRIGVVRQAVEVSSRRYMQGGTLAQIWRNAQVLYAYYFLKIRGVALKQIYEGHAKGDDVRRLSAISTKRETHAHTTQR